MRILVLRDRKLDKEAVEGMFSSLKDDYKNYVDVSWEYQDINADLPFEIYYGDNYGLSKKLIYNETRKIFAERGYELDHIVWVFSRESWKAPGIGGWNLGRLYNNYSVQLVLAEQRSKWAGKTLKMEIAHAFDELAPIELGINLDKMVGKDWDNDIVHGEHPDWGVWNERKDKYWTNYDYTKMIRWYGYIFNNIYSKRREKQPKAVDKKDIIIQKLIQIRRLLRLIIQARGATPVALFLEGEHKHEKVAK